MRFPVTRPYRLFGAVIAGAVLLALALAAAPPAADVSTAAGDVGTEAGDRTEAVPDPGADQGRPAVRPDAPAGVPAKTATIALGSFAEPAHGVISRSGVPRGIPLADDAKGLRKARSTRTLAVRRASTQRFSAVGVTWTGDKAQVSVAVRTHVPGKGWTSWTAVGGGGADRDPGESPGREGAEMLWTGPADGVEVVASGTKAEDVTADLIDPGEAPGDEAAGNAPAVAAPGDGRVAMPPIARRSAWGADERQMTWQPGYARGVKAVAWHHTATTNSYAAVDVPRILRAIYHYQAVSRGWGDIGYNVLVDRFGRLWEGRYGGLSRAVIGAHAGGFNRNTAGIAVIGDHRSTPVPPAVVESSARYVAWKLSLGPGVDPRGATTLTGGGSTSRHPPGTTVTVPRIFPHRLTNHTECPGARGMDPLSALRDRAYALMGVWADPATVRMRLATWRPSDARWRIMGAADPTFAGVAGDVPVPADYDGDGVTDLATWSPTTGTWRIHNSGAGTTEQLTLGGSGDRPVPADFDGDGRADAAVWRPSDGLWQVRGAPPVVFGYAGDVPLPADYDGDGRADVAVWRPSTGTWLMYSGATYRLGEAYHVPVPADYDGDGAVDPAAWSPLTQRFFVWGMAPIAFGAPGDVPVPGQYDGDGRADLAVWRPPAQGRAEGTWLVNRVGTFTFGTNGDSPVPLA